MDISLSKNLFVYKSFDANTRRVFLACEKPIRDIFSPNKDLISNAAAIANVCRYYLTKLVNETESKGIFLDMQGWRDLCNHACDKADWKLIAECLSEEYDNILISSLEEQY